MHRIDQAGDQTDAIQHDPRRAGSEDRVLQRRFARQPFALEHAGQNVRRDAGHLHGHEDHQQVIGSHHQAEAQSGSQRQHVHIRPIFPRGHTGQFGEYDEQDEKTQQHSAHEGGKTVIHEHARENLHPLKSLAEIRGQSPGGCDPQCQQRASQRQPGGIDATTPAKQTEHEHGQHGDADHDLGTERPQARIPVGYSGNSGRPSPWCQ